MARKENRLVLTPTQQSSVRGAIHAQRFKHHEVASRIGVTKHTFSRVLSGKTSIQMDSLRHLLKILGLDSKAFLAQTELFDEAFVTRAKDALSDELAALKSEIGARPTGAVVEATVGIRLHHRGRARAEYLRIFTLG